MNPNLRNFAMTETYNDDRAITGEVDPIKADLSDNRAFQLNSMLQTTLELEQQLELFLHEVRRSLDIASLHYTHTAPASQIDLGLAQSQSSRYDLSVHGDDLGQLRFTRAQPFTIAELEQLENLLCILVYPLRNALRYRLALDQALRDPLTGAQNRSAFQTTLDREFDLARRQGVPLSLIVLDIDHFKHFNDNYGHSFGDDVLKAVTTSADSTIRRSDLMFRYGGEEFVIVASHTDLEGAHLLAERIRQNIEALGTVAGREVCITASLGVAELKPDDSTTRLFDRADKALYRAKAQGRNQTVID